MKAQDKYEGETNEKKRSLARRILVFGVATSILFLVVAYGVMMG